KLLWAEQNPARARAARHSDGCGRLHRLAEPLRHLRPGRERLRVGRRSRLQRPDTRPGRKLCHSGPDLRGMDFVYGSTQTANIGFRVVSLVPEPGTIALVMMGLAGLA